MPQSSTPADPRRALRKELRARRNALAVNERIAAADAVARHLQTDPDGRRAGYVAGYWACAGELPLHRVQMGLAADQIWCLPLIQPDGRLRFAPWRAGDALLPNRFGIPEPAVEAAATLPAEAMSLVLLPLLGFDRSGQRLGTGGGYYDRSFAFRHQRSAPPVLIGMAYAVQEIPSLPAERWDVPLDLIITERERIQPARSGAGR